jgi:hypothetical protein
MDFSSKGKAKKNIVALTFSWYRMVEYSSCLIWTNIGVPHWSLTIRIVLHIIFYT